MGCGIASSDAGASAGVATDDALPPSPILRSCLVCTNSQSIGGPFDKNGAIGQQFTTEGAIGGNVQIAAENVSGGEHSALC